MHEQVKAPKALSIQITLTTSNKYEFGLQDVLRGKKILNLIPTGAGTANTTQQSSDGTLIANNVDESGFLTLKDQKNNEIWDAVPFWVLDPKVNGSGYPVYLGVSNIDWQKSYFTIDAGIVGNTGKKVVLTVFYED